MHNFRFVLIFVQRFAFIISLVLNDTVFVIHRLTTMNAMNGPLTE